ncbi:penicillin-binding protein 1A [Candidatus Finniella inopinata]|uniref:peptidoglycan glycosyltransferase n=1 Tax=Candidatus Finniella inopinata TaxID=1696036 RepID=A0A4Q7DIX0_9PROT|nr:PBP1A family penicillin-binding protein [Candidatus Finniella inopinata]RZI46290.1 PBP1A family penicillin-binding protein [Candidatus Finniella inopinata]
MRQFLHRLILFLIFGVTATTSSAFFIFFYYGRGLPNYDYLTDYQPPQASRLFANNYQLIKEYAVERRFFKPLNQMPPRLIQAFLAAEDRNFYYHFGLDFSGLLRAVLTNTLKKSWQNRPLGASTITQQVAKNFLVGNEASFKRKIKEAVISIRLELSLPKNRILELYLNQVYLGRGSYGVTAAAQAYFGKSLDDLSLEECAFLAALPKAPSIYDRESEAKKVQGRRDWVLDRMLQEGAITIQNCRVAQGTLVTILKPEPLSHNADYFAEETRRQLQFSLGRSDLSTAGLNVFTTLDPDLQTIAHESLQQGLLAYDPTQITPEVSGGIVVMEAETGNVLALSGGFDFFKSQFNCATQAWRQTGSAFKPIVYLSALEQGYTPETLIHDGPVKINLGRGLGYYQPKNFTRKYYGLCPLRIGIEQSRNAMTVKLAQQIGMEPIQRMAARLGVISHLPNQLSMALGAGETTLLRMTTAYCMIVNGGKKMRPLFFHKIENHLGETIFEPDQGPEENVLDAGLADEMTDMLRSVVHRGTGRRLSYLAEKYQMDIGGKTGTTNDCFDAWFIGFIKQPMGPTLVIGIFVGFLKPKSLGRHGTGSRVALPIFENFVKSYGEKMMNARKVLEVS